VVAIFTKRIGPAQCGQTIMSTAKTRASSHAHAPPDANPFDLVLEIGLGYQMWF
jgi:hypothetical protein